ncbi:MAG: hypothetical protein H0U70_06690 [Tatlockia sp.]|nr:hypothetical protein [Tatlockia sp.]
MNLTIRLKLLVFLPVCLLVFFLWLPFGFSLTGLIEEWQILRLFDSDGPIFFAKINTPFAEHALRPLTVFPHSVAYSLDPNSFFYWHVLLIIALLIKGAAFTRLVWQATNSCRWSIIAGLLLIVYPADTMQLSMRALHINWALSCLLLASTLFISAFGSSKPMKVYPLAFISAILLWVSLAMYEASLMLVFVPFLMIYAKEGWKTSLEQRYRAKTLITLWILSIVIYLVYVAIIAPKINSYQQSFLSQSISSILAYTLPKLFSPGITHSLFGGWINAVHMVSKEISYVGYIYLLVVISLIFGLIYLFNKKSQEGMAATNNHSIVLMRLLIVGLLLSVLGYLPFLVSPAHTAISQRTFLMASPGAVLFWISLLMLLAKRKKMLASGLAVFLITIGFGMQLFQFHHYLAISEMQRTVLRNIVANFDGSSNKKALILLDEGNQLTSTWMLINLKGALSYFYKKPIDALEVCFMPGKEWRNMGIRAGSCIEQDKQWIFRSLTKATTVESASILVPDKVILKNEAVVLKVKPDGSIESASSLVNYRASLTQTSSQATRYQQILTPIRWPNYFKHFWTANDLEKYRWSFGNWWSMDLPIRGTGWREAEWNKDNFSYKASSWKNEENASLLFDLLPRKSAYSLQGKFHSLLNVPIRDSIQISLNEHLISYKWLSINEFWAEIPANNLLTGVNRIMFHSITEPKMDGLSLSLASFELLPNEQLHKEQQ